MAIRTKDEVILDLITNILRSSDKADTFPGQVLRDVVVNAPSSEFERLYSQVNRLSISQSIANANLMTIKEMDDLVSNFGITRKGAQKSFSSISFYTATIPSSQVIIPQGTTIGTNLGIASKETTFSTSADAIFDPSQAGIFFNPNTGNYQITIDIVCNTAGTIGNVGPFTISKIKNGNFPFNATNYNAATGGVDQESNNDLAIRSLNILLGSNVGTKTGYDGTTLSQQNVLDALVVGPGDDLMTRDGGYGGKVDIWAITSPAGITSQNANNNTDLLIPSWNYGDQFNNSFRFNFPLLPVNADSPIIITATSSPSGVTNALLYESRAIASTGVSYMNPSGSFYHYTVYLSDDNETGHSVEAGDHLLWNPDEMEYLRTFNPSGTVASGNVMSVSISYSYDQTIVSTQNVINADNQHIITADVLVKQAQEILVDVTMNVKLFPAFQETATTTQQTIANVEDSIISKINNTQLGNTVEESDLIQAAHNVEGVDNVIVASIRITKKRPSFFDVGSQQITDDTSAKNQYFSADVIRVTPI